MRTLPTLCLLVLGLHACGPEVIPYQPPPSDMDAGMEDVVKNADASLPPEDMGGDMSGDADMSEVDLAPDLGACGGVCADPTPACNADTGTCVACLQDAECGAEQVCDPQTNLCVACLEDTQCADTQRCELTTQTCVACLEQADCTKPGASSCGTDLSCQACTTDDECSHLTGLNSCDEGVCVACTPGTEVQRCGANSCDPVSLTCTSTPRGTVDVCEACQADSECILGGCVELMFGPTGSQVSTGSYCLPERIANCSSTLYSTTKSVVTRSGQTLTVCGPVEQLTTCPALQDYLDAKTCPQADENNFSSVCGQDGLDDGVCLTKFIGNPTPECSTLCEKNSDCASSESCQPITAGVLLGKKACKQ